MTIDNHLYSSGVWTKPQSENSEAPNSHYFPTLQNSGFHAFIWRLWCLQSKQGQWKCSCPMASRSIHLDWGVSRVQGPSWTAFPSTVFISPEPTTPVISDYRWKKKQSFSEQRCQHFEIITRELLPLLGLVAAPNCPVLGWIAGVPMHYCSTVSLIFVGNFCVQASREVVVLCTQCLCRNASSSAFLFIPWDQKEFRQGKANRVCDQRAICSLNRERCGRRGHRQVLGMEWQPTQNYLPS